jgi:hypothetical protein
MRAALLLCAVLTLIPRAASPQGNPLGPEFRVNTYTTDDQAQPSVAADSAGNFVVVWEGYYSLFDNHIFGQRFAGSGDPLGPEFQVSTSMFASHSVPSVATDGAENFIVVWTIQFLTGYDSRGRRYASSGVPLGSEFVVGNAFYNAFPAVAADSSGNFVIVWQNLTQDGSGDGIFGQRYDSSGAPVGPEFRVNTFTTNYQRRPSLAADASGNFVVVWQSVAQDGSSKGVFGQRFASSGAALGSEFRVNTYTTDDQAYPSVAADSAGNFIVVWQSMGQDGSNEGVFGQRFASSGVLVGTEFRINTYTTRGQDTPAVAADPAGNFVVTWQTLQDGSGYGVFGQRYDSSGAPIGLEFRVNTYTTNFQRYPAVAADSSGDFVVVWQSAAQDGFLEGVFGQRYRPILPVELMRFRVE